MDHIPRPLVPLFDPAVAAPRMGTVLVLGKRAVGKTTLVKDLLRHVKWGGVHIINPVEPYRGEYAEQGDDIHGRIHGEYSEAVVDGLVDELKELKRTRTHDDDSATSCAVFENCEVNQWPRHASMRRLLMHGRSLGVNVIMTMQYPLSRLREFIGVIDYVFVFRDACVSNRQRVYDMLGRGAFPTFGEFEATFQRITATPFACMVIRLGCCPPPPPSGTSPILRYVATPPPSVFI